MKAKKSQKVEYGQITSDDKPLIFIMRNVTSASIPTYIPKYMKKGEYDNQRYKLKVDITNNKEFINFLNKMDTLLREFGQDINNNPNYTFDESDPTSSDNTKYFPICKKPTKKKLSIYRENHKDDDNIKNKSDKEVMEILKTYFVMNFKMPYIKSNDNDTYTKDTCIEPITIKKDDNVDFDIERPQTLDFLNELLSWGNNVDIIFSINTWYYSSSMYGYKVFVKGIKLHSINNKTKISDYDFDEDDNTTSLSEKKVFNNEDESDDNQEKPTIKPDEDKSENNSSEEEDKKKKKKNIKNGRKTNNSNKKGNKKVEKEDSDDNIEDD